MSKRYSILKDKAWLRKRYLSDKLSGIQIAKIVGCEETAVYKALKRFGIPLRSSSAAHRGQIPTNKGETEFLKLKDAKWLDTKYWIERLSINQIAEIVGCSDETVRRAFKRHGIKRRTISEAGKGKKRSEESKIKYSINHADFSGKNNPNYGKVAWNRGKHPSEETRKKISKANSGKNCYWYGRQHTEDAKQKMREARKHRKFPTHHTKPELIFEGFCKKDSLPFKYTGDGSFWVGKGKDVINPDFTHLTRKIVVEIFSWFHDPINNRNLRPKAHYDIRKKIFKKYGYKMIVFWQEDLERLDAEQFVLATLKKEKVI